MNFPIYKAAAVGVLMTGLLQSYSDPDPTWPTYIVNVIAGQVIAHIGRVIFNWIESHRRPPLQLEPPIPVAIERGLQAWCNDKKGTDEYERRLNAAEKIRRCYATGGIRLNLSSNRLTSLPPEIGSLTALTHLDLYNNQLTSLPPEIGSLTALTYLNLSSNQLTALPSEIGSLTALTYLNLYNNRLTSLPPEIGSLTALTHLDLYNNQLTSLPPEIGSLTALTYLNLYNNQLTSLPPEIGSLTALTYLNLYNNRLTALPPEIGSLTALTRLNLYNNQLTSLPSEIGSLTALTYLDLSNNRLTALPVEITGLPPSCTIDLTGCPFSQPALERLTSMVSQEGYQGSRISHSITQIREARDLTLDEALKELYDIIKTPQPTFSNLIAEPRNRQSLRLWLNRLSYTADFQKGGDVKKKLAQKIAGYLELAENNPQFRERFFHIIDGAARTCGDRVALSIIHLGIQKRLANIDLKNKDELIKLLIHGVWAVDQLEKIAREKISTLVVFDEIEVHLGYLVQLRKKLNLPLDVEEMLFFGCSNLSQTDLDSAFEKVSKELQNPEAVCAFLAQNDLWQKALVANHPEEYQKAMEEYEKMGFNGTHPLIELTQKVMNS